MAKSKMVITDPKILNKMLKKENLASHDKGKATEWEDAVRARFLNGFINWNKGYEPWVEWCKDLYEPDCRYNILAPEPLTLEQYQKSMKVFTDAFEIVLQPIDNLLIEGDWGAIRYDMKLTGKKGGQFYGIDVTGKKATLRTMEFVQYKYNPEPIGPRVKLGVAIADALGLLQQLGVLPGGRIEGDIDDVDINKK